LNRTGCQETRRGSRPAWSALPILKCCWSGYRPWLRLCRGRSGSARGSHVAVAGRRNQANPDLSFRCRGLEQGRNRQRRRNRTGYESGGRGPQESPSSSASLSVHDAPFVSGNALSALFARMITFARCRGQSDSLPKLKTRRFYRPEGRASQFFNRLTRRELGVSNGDKMPITSHCYPMRQSVLFWPMIVSAGSPFACEPV